MCTGPWESLTVTGLSRSAKRVMTWMPASEANSDWKPRRVAESWLPLVTTTVAPASRSRTSTEVRTV